MIYIGIDPGKTGAIVALDATNWSIALAWTADGPDGYYRDGEPDPLVIADRLRPLRESGVALVAIETPFAPRAVGTANALHMGLAWGLLLGAVLAARLPLRRVTPAAWSVAILGAPPKGGWPDRAKKQASARCAAERLPQLRLVLPGRRVAHDGLSDAACVALWAVRSIPW